MCIFHFADVKQKTQISRFKVINLRSVYYGSWKQSFEACTERWTLGNGIWCNLFLSTPSCAEGSSGQTEEEGEKDLGASKTQISLPEIQNLQLTQSETSAVLVKKGSDGNLRITIWEHSKIASNPHIQSRRQSSLWETKNPTFQEDIPLISWRTISSVSICRCLLGWKVYID